MKSLNRWKKHRTAVLSRLLGLYLLLGLWSLTLVGRLVYLQIFKSEEYRLKAEQQHFGYIELSPKRGDILDRHLDELAISVKIDSVFVHPEEVIEPLLTARALAPLLQAPPTLGTPSDQKAKELLRRQRGQLVFPRRRQPSAPWPEA